MSEAEVLLMTVEEWGTQTLLERKALLSSVELGHERVRHERRQEADGGVASPSILIALHMVTFTPYSLHMVQIRLTYGAKESRARGQRGVILQYSVESRKKKPFWSYFITRLTDKNL